MFEKYMERSTRMVLIGTLLLSSYSVTAQAGKHCNTVVADQHTLVAATTIGIRPLTIDCPSPFPQDVHDKWAGELPRLLIEELKNRGIKNAVYLEDGLELAVDLIIEGKITALDKGNAAGRIMLNSSASAASMTMEIRILDSNTSEPVAEGACMRSAQGGPLGMGGLLAGSSKVIMHNHMERFAKQIAKFVANGGSGKKKNRNKSRKNG